MNQISDIERIIGRINSGKVTPKEINPLCISLEQIPIIKSLLDDSKQKKLISFNKFFKNTNHEEVCLSAFILIKTHDSCYS